MSLRIDLNADLGEGAGHDEELLALISSASIACGGHAGDSATMAATLAAAKAHGVAVGAHPSFPDRTNFGRTEMSLPPEELRTALRAQLQLFHQLAAEAGVPPRHVKPHGALYNMAARDRALAELICDTIAAFDPSLRLFAPPASEFTAAAQSHGLAVAREFFADRHYLPDGRLVPRSQPDALLHDAGTAVARVLEVLEHRRVRSLDETLIPMEIDTICLHGDSPHAVEFARVLHRTLQSAGVEIAAPRC
jgi:UPF0271 protein